MSSIKKVIWLSGGSTTSDVPIYRYTRFMNPVLDVSKDAEALDNSQMFPTAGWEDDDYYWVIYTGQSAASIVYAPDGRTYQNVDQGFLCRLAKSNTVNTGWEKILDVNGDPKPLIQPSTVSGAWDRLQVWPRAVIKEGSTLKCFYMGQNAGGVNHRIGLTTSTNNGTSWSKSASNPVYEDADSKITVHRVINDGTNYKMFYSCLDPQNEGFFIAESADGISWSRTHTNVLLSLHPNYICAAKYISGTYYLWIQMDNTSGILGNGPGPEIFLFTSTDLTTWTNLGAQIKYRGTQEWAIGADAVMFQKPNGNWFMVHCYVKNAIEVSANGGEQFTGMKVAELNRSDAPIANKPSDYSYPSYVQRHYPLGPEFYSKLVFGEVINGDAGTINSNAAFARYHFLSLTGSQTVTFPAVSINQTSFAVKLRVQIKTTGTHELFRIGNDVLVTLESGKLRVRISDDGAGYDKDWITTVNISEPSGIDYPDDHVYVGFTWIGGVLTMYNDFVPFTAGEITETVDNSLTGNSINNSGSSVLIGQNATIELRSVSILNGATDQQFIDLDI